MSHRSFRTTGTLDVAALLARADDALYRAQAAGRDRAVTE